MLSWLPGNNPPDSTPVSENRLRPTLAAILQLQVITLNLLCERADIPRQAVRAAIEQEFLPAKNEYYRKTLKLFREMLEAHNPKWIAPHPDWEEKE